MQLLSSLQGKARFFRALPHFLVVCWRKNTGRLFYMRDRPSWFVQYMADMGRAASEEDTPELMEIFAEARRERLARIDQAMRAMKNEAPPELYELFDAMRDSLRIDTGIPRSGRTVVGKTPR